ncbi:type I restriction-modification system subunit M N-terminal domain-containing protein [Cupriavidus sp. KK10]|uniref:type I restriction-modification system subunit M N-terminal domain-containing protein n=1 Tax=Cupriavidus sp. KK10 TaxID=1478019 RepID=UPI002012ABB1|nr:type I restriction-modification system subunit M N-terminal domain-containing protein [Cupriavidus sp. KK10]
MLEQITYLLFIRRLDDAHTLEENKAANRPTGAGIEGRLPNGGHTLRIQRRVETGTAC